MMFSYAKAMLKSALISRMPIVVYDGTVSRSVNAIRWNDDDVDLLLDGDTICGLPFVTLERMPSGKLDDGFMLEMLDSCLLVTVQWLFR